MAALKVSKDCKRAASGDNQAARVPNGKWKRSWKRGERIAKRCSLIWLQKERCGLFLGRTDWQINYLKERRREAHIVCAVFGLRESFRSLIRALRKGQASKSSCLSLLSLADFSFCLTLKLAVTQSEAETKREMLRWHLFCRQEKARDRQTTCWVMVYIGLN